MSKIFNLINARTQLKATLFCLSFLFFQLFAYSQEKSLDGAKLFKANCAACHSVGSNKVVGPGLQGVNEKRDREWLGKWISNSSEFIASGDPDANAIFNEFNKITMPPQAVSPEEIDAILAYIENPGTEEAAPVETASTDKQKIVEEDNSVIYYLLGIVILLLLVLAIVLINMKIESLKILAKDEGREYDGPNSIISDIRLTLKNNQKLIAVLVIIFIFAGLVKLMDGAFQIGVHQGYKPEQPIKFSHKIHAGLDKIDCNYCHSSARHSKTSGIPSLNVCMNCHKAIDGSNGKTFMYNGTEYSMTEEIQKLYDHLDYNKDTQVYGDNPTPVKWIKVHNLPDHVFFSHQQHVVAGKQQCQTCHGKIQDMDVVAQDAPLTMKWCIQCHQATSVADQGNGYYDDMHARMTPEFKEKVMSDGKLTVDEIGGWECAKCHY